MPPVQILLIAALAGGIYLAGRPVVRAAKKASHKVCHVVTLGKKCMSAGKKAKP